MATLRNRLDFGFGSCSFVSVLNVVTGVIEHYNATRYGNDMSQLVQNHLKTVGKPVGIVSILLVTTLRDDVTIELQITANTALRVLQMKFPTNHLVVKILNNPNVVRNSSNAPLPAAQALYDGAVGYICNKSNTLGAIGTNAIFSLTTMLDVRGKEYSDDSTCFPGSIAYLRENDTSGRPLTGSQLSDFILNDRVGQTGYVTASCYGMTTRPIELDTDGKTHEMSPNVNFSTRDDIIIGCPSFDIFGRNYHGEYMHFPYLTDISSHPYGITGTGIEVYFSEGTAIWNALENAVNGILPPDPRTIVCGILTTNKKKLSEMKEWLPKIFRRVNHKFGGKLVDYKVLVYSVPFLEMREGQELDPTKSMEEKFDSTRLTPTQLNAILGMTFVCIDDTSFSMHAMDGGPGTFYKSYFEQMKDKPVTYNKLITTIVQKKVSEGMFDANRAVATTVFGCVINTGTSVVNTRILISTVSGTVPVEPHAIPQFDFGWDSVFIADGMSTTFAMNSSDVNEQFKPRGRVAEELMTISVLYIAGQKVDASQYTTIATSQQSKEIAQRMQRTVTVATAFAENAVTASQTATQAEISAAAAVQSAIQGFAF